MSAAVDLPQVSWIALRPAWTAIEAGRVVVREIRSGGEVDFVPSDPSNR
jgi:hypothetical protein